MNFNGSHYDASLTDYIRSTGRLTRMFVIRWYGITRDDTFANIYIGITSFFEAVRRPVVGVIARNAFLIESRVSRTKCLLCGVDSTEIYENDRYYENTFSWKLCNYMLYDSSILNKIHWNLLYSHRVRECITYVWKALKLCEPISFPHLVLFSACGQEFQIYTYN